MSKTPLRGEGMRDGRGFTLVELLTVVAIIGILAVVALPSIDVQRYRVEGGIQSAGTALLAAQQYAVTRQHDVVVQFDVARAAVRLHYDANNNGTVDGGERTRGIPLGESVVFGLGGAAPRPMGSGPVTFSRRVGGLPAVVFHRNGSASEAGGVYLTSRRATVRPGYASDTRALEVERSTGRTSWFRWSRRAWQRGF